MIANVVKIDERITLPPNLFSHSHTALSFKMALRSQKECYFGDFGCACESVVRRWNQTCNEGIRLLQCAYQSRINLLIFSKISAKKFGHVADSS